MWPEERREQLVHLEYLIRECRAINTSSNIIQRLQGLEHLAEELDHGKIRPLSFMSWLKNEAMKGDQ